MHSYSPYHPPPHPLPPPPSHPPPPSPPLLSTSLSKDMLSLYHGAVLMLEHTDENKMALKVHVHPLTSRLKVQKCKKIAAIICRKSEDIQTDKAV
ncbi:hypothetical protein DPMN_079589 [Dreissena polymorpha]|uniref:Uncharacterized protein n=1 Tax=Dreissena polymorpha TaxID=45954 RepID=A0A9D3YUR1_DREPO|nr:hypothetical protein DPMN_079589 [Dreissena polymorpha]